MYADSQDLPNHDQLPQDTDIPCLDTISISESDVYKALDPTKAMGIDRIGPWVLKHCSSTLTEPICHILKVSLTTGSILSEWHIHHIIPILKKGDKTHITNYQPISLLPVISKAYL